MTYICGCPKTWQKNPGWGNFSRARKMSTSTNTTQIQANEAADLVARVCEHLAIAYSSNRVHPSLADLTREGREFAGIDELNAIGKSFGIRFREMVGGSRDLVSTVTDSGPLLVVPGIHGDPGATPILVLQAVGSKLLIHQAGADKKVSVGWLKSRMQREPGNLFRWYLIQPMLAAENASRFHYQGGSQDQPLRPLPRLLAFLRPERRDLKTILVFSVVIGLLSLTTPLAVEAVVNTIAFGRYLQPLIILSLMVLIFLGFRAGLSVLMTVVTEVIQRKLFVRTVEDLSYRLTRVPLPTWKKYHGPELVNRFFDIVNIQKITSKLLLETLMLLLQTVIGLTVLAFYHPFLLGYDIGMLVMMTIVLYFIGRGAVKTAKEESQLKYETAAWLQELVRHPSSFKFNGGLGFAINRADELTSRYVGSRQKHFRILIRQISFSMAMQVVAATVLLALGGYLVIEQQMTLGQLVAAELIVTVILGSFAKLGKDLESFYDLMASVDKLGALFDLPVEPTDKLQLARLPGAYSIELSGFKLDGQQNSTANLELPAGCNVAICAADEARRSRLMDTLIGQEKPDQGYVLLNDFRVDAISAESLQGKISLVRDIELFEGSVDENVRLGRDVSSDQVNQIVEQLKLRQIISSLPDGYATQLKISGYPLTQGQCIRLMLARALISRPGVLFLDGLLDRLSDRDTLDVLSCLESYFTGTTLVIATGRQVIADWAQLKLDIEPSRWNLAKSTG